MYNLLLCFSTSTLVGVEVYSFSFSFVQLFVAAEYLCSRWSLSTISIPSSVQLFAAVEYFYTHFLYIFSLFPSSVQILRYV